MVNTNNGIIIYTDVDQIEMLKEITKSLLKCNDKNKTEIIEMSQFKKGRMEFYIN